MSVPLESRIDQPHAGGSEANPAHPGDEFQLPLFDATAMRRIHACVMACEGIATEELEAGIVQEMRQTLLQLVPMLEASRRIKQAS